MSRRKLGFDGPTNLFLKRASKSLIRLWRRQGDRFEFVRIRRVRYLSQYWWESIPKRRIAMIVE